MARLRSPVVGEDVFHRSGKGGGREDVQQVLARHTLFSAAAREAFGQEGPRALPAGYESPLALPS
jgi:hypothetical protein